MDVKQTVKPAASTTFAVFFSNLINCRHPLKNGKDCIFLNGRYLTQSEEEVKELMAEIDAGHPHLYINPDEMVVDTKFVDPVEAIRAQVMADLKARGLLIAGAEADFGKSDQETKLTVGTTRDVAEAMSGSTSVDSGAGLTSGGIANAGGAKIVAGPVSK